MAVYTIQNVGSYRYVSAVSDTTNVSGTSSIGLTSITNSSLSNNNNAKWVIIGGLNASKNYIMSYNNTDVGFNAYRANSPYQCNLHKIYGNELDAAVEIKAIANMYLQYYIKLSNYNMYLTMTNTGSGTWNITWAPYTGNDTQRWFISKDTTITSVMSCPVSYNTISRGFKGTSADHLGVDFVNVSGTNIKAAADGTVIFTQIWNGTLSGLQALGNAIYIKHTDGSLSIYMHMLEPPTNYVSINSTVKKGDIIGKIGNTGDSQGAHLHFAYKTGANFTSNAYNEGVWKDPLKYMY